MAARSSRALRPALAAAAALALHLATALPAQAATPLLIWPVDPVVEPDRRAAALWLENRGSQPAVLQIRIYRWTQPAGDDRFADQRAVEASPPIVEIPAGARQMVRLTAPPRDRRDGGETAYRVIIDEVPADAPEGGAAGKSGAGSGIRFQMRYSIPLFVYGANAAPPARDATDGAGLRCTLARSADGGGELRLTNTGQTHVRLLNVRFETGARTIPVANGLLGYALPGATIVRKLPAGATGREPLVRQGPQGQAIAVPGCAEQ